MKGHEYFAHLRAIFEDNPKILDFDCVYSTDDEGNRFEFVNFSPTVGLYILCDSVFELKEFSEVKNCTDIANALCIN